jgi:heat shock protein HslJ
MGPTLVRTLGFLSLFAMAACAAPAPGIPADAAPGGAEVAGRTWHAEGSTGMDEATRPRLEFRRDGKLAGFTGCNSIAGTWRDSGGAIQLSALAVTKRFCVGPRGEFEKRFLAAVNEKSKLSLANGQLVATGPNGERLAFTSP